MKFTITRTPICNSTSINPIYNLCISGQGSYADCEEALRIMSPKRRKNKKNKTITSIKSNENGTIDITDSEGITYKGCYLTDMENNVKEEGIITIPCTMSFVKEK